MPKPSPIARYSELYCRLKRSKQLCVPGSYATPALEVEEGVFHQVPHTIKLFGIITLRLAVLFRRNDNFATRFDGLIYNRIAVAATIRRQELNGDAVDQKATACVQFAVAPAVTAAVQNPAHQATPREAFPISACPAGE